MHIAIIGTGNVGRAVVLGLKGKGHDITFGTRNPEDPALHTFAAAAGASVATPADAARGADVILIALPWAAVESAVAALGDLTGKIVIDCTNPIARTPAGMGLALGHTASGGEAVQRWLPLARVVKTLNQTGAEIIADAPRLPHSPVMFMAGNDDTAKIRVAEILTDLGFDPLDAGDITQSRLLEPFAMVWINQAILRAKGRNWAFAAIS